MRFELAIVERRRFNYNVGTLPSVNGAGDSSQRSHFSTEIQIHDTEGRRTTPITNIEIR